MSLFVFLLLTLGVIAVLASLLRRFALLAGLIVAVGMGGLAWWLWQLPNQETATVFGRMVFLERSNTLLGFSFALSPLARAPFLLILMWGAVIALVAGLLKIERSFIPSIPLLAGVFQVALSVEPLLWTPFWLMIVAVLMGIIAQGSRPRSARAALRILATPILAFPFFLFAAWVFSQSAVAAEDPALWANAWRALLIGMLIFTSPAPLHAWIPALGEAASPFAGALLVGSWQIAVYAFLRRLLFAYPAITEFIDPGLWLPWIGVIQMVWAGVFMFGSQRLGQLWGYLLLWMYGATFLTWGLTGELGGDALFGLFLVTPIALAAAAAGLQSMVHRFGEEPAYGKLHGVTERLPLSALGFIGGGLFLLGWPLGALFPIRLSVWQVAEFRAGNIFLWGVLAWLLAVLGLIRALRHLATPVEDPTLARESSLSAWTIGVLLTASLALSINPALFAQLSERLLIWFNTF